MTEIEELKARIAVLERILMISDKYLFQKPLVGGPNGLRLGSKAGDKLAFYDVAPIAKYSGVIFNGVPGGTYGSTEATTLAGLRTALLAYGLIRSV